MLKRILVGISGAPGTEAKIAWVLDLAKRHGASVTVLSVINRDQLRKVGPVPLGASYYAEHLGQDRIEHSMAAAEMAVESSVPPAPPQQCRCGSCVRKAILSSNWSRLGATPTSVSLGPGAGSTTA